MIPEYFCWTRYGTEAGESIDMILKRKEEERLQNDGVFLWGIGNSIGPAIKELLTKTDTPKVLFSPITTKARDVDRAPECTVQWTSGRALDGSLRIW